MNVAEMVAEENRSMCDSMLMDLAEGSGDITVYYPSLWIREIHSQDKKALEDAMQYLDCSFSFEAKEVFVNNAFAYEIELPRMIYE